MKEFQSFIKAVGTGPKGNRDLSFAESKRAMQLILSKEVPADMISAFLIGFRLKPETIEEYQGCLDALLEKTNSSVVPQSIELGFPFDGKAKYPYLFPLVAKELQSKNIQLVITGDDKVPSKDGVTINELINHIQVPINVHYFDRQKYLPELHQLTTLRNNLGLRSAFNTLEKASLVGQSEFAAFGVFHKPYVAKYTEIFRSKFKYFLIVQANEGSPEIIKKGNVWKVGKENVEEVLIDPSFFGINISELEFEENSSQLDVCIDLLKSPTPGMLKLAKLNAAALVWLYNEGSSFENALELVNL